MANYREELLQADRVLMTAIIRQVRARVEGQPRRGYGHVKCSICQQSVRKTKGQRMRVHSYKDSTGERVRCPWSRRLVE